MANAVDVEALIVQANRDEGDARGELLAGYRNYLRTMARIWIDGSMDALIEPSDVVQETLLRAHRGFGDFRGSSERELIGWLRRILARYLIDATRRFRAGVRPADLQKKVESELEASADRLHRLVASPGSSPSRIAQRREMMVVLADALQQLAEHDREVIVLRSLEELDWRTIAEKMGRSSDAARVLWTRALQRLRPLLEDNL